jgi:hypothetical protein
MQWTGGTERVVHGPTGSTGGYDARVKSLDPGGSAESQVLDDPDR